jgi:hypothetical protein
MSCFLYRTNEILRGGNNKILNQNVYEIRGRKEHGQRANVIDDEITAFEPQNQIISCIRRTSFGTSFDRNGNKLNEFGIKK